MEDNVREKIRDAVLTEQEKEILREEKTDLYDYQQEVMDCSSDRIAFVGGRQVGKTKLAIEWAKENDADIVAPNHRMAKEIESKCGVRVFSEEANIGRVFRAGNNIVFDEAATMDLSMRKIDNHYGKILMVGTDVYLDYNNFIEFCKNKDTKVFSADMYDCPQIDGQYIDQFMEKAGTASVCQEIEGKFVVDPKEM
jgi:hypothetical protein